MNDPSVLALGHLGNRIPSKRRIEGLRDLVVGHLVLDDPKRWKALSRVHFKLLGKA
jgi:hypothetical protein